jgi:phosphoribosylglycinamide formyltransferase-1
MLKIAILVSGGGSNLQAIIDEIGLGNLNSKIEMVISDRHGALGLTRAKENAIKVYIVSRDEHKDKLSDKILKLTEGKVDLIVLAGFCSIIKGEILKVFENKIINIHPSLIPSFCGKGMYGMKVHEAAIESGVNFTGCTVHFVDEKVDHGAIILQEVVPVFFEDTKEILKIRVLEKEHVLLPKVIGLIEQKKVEVLNGRIKILS